METLKESSGYEEWLNGKSPGIPRETNSKLSQYRETPPCDEQYSVPPFGASGEEKACWLLDSRMTGSASRSFEDKEWRERQFQARKKLVATEILSIVKQLTKNINQ